MCRVVLLETQAELGQERLLPLLLDLLLGGLSLEHQLVVVVMQRVGLNHGLRNVRGKLVAGPLQHAKGAHTKSDDVYIPSGICERVATCMGV